MYVNTLTTAEYLALYRIAVHEYKTHYNKALRTYIQRPSIHVCVQHRGMYTLKLLLPYRRRLP